MKFLTWLFPKKKVKDCAEVSPGLEDWLIPMQHLLNEINIIVGESSWKVENWTLSDMARFMAAIERVGRGH